MDEYYANLARGSLAKAEGELLNAQNYIRQSAPDDYKNIRVQRILSSIRKLTDDINNHLIVDRWQSFPTINQRKENDE